MLVNGGNDAQDLSGFFENPIMVGF